MVGVGRERDFLDRLEPLGRALDAPFPVRPLEVVGAGLKEMRGDVPGLLLDLAGGDGRRGAGDRRRARRIRPEPVRRGVGVALLDLDVRDREAELLGDDLRERGLVTLALRLDAEPGDHLAGRVDADLARVEHLDPEDVEVVRRARADDLGEAADADAHELAAGALLDLLATEPLVVDEVHRLAERLRSQGGVSLLGDQFRGIVRPRFREEEIGDGAHIAQQTDSLMDERSYGA